MVFPYSILEDSDNNIMVNHNLTNPKLYYSKIGIVTIMNGIIIQK